MPQLKYIRNDAGEYVCPTCGVTKANQNTMHYHMKKHSDSLPFSCKHCNKGFLQKQTLNMHISSKHSDDTDSDTREVFECPFDGCTFSAMTKGNLRTHALRTHFLDDVEEILSIDTETKIISCTVCDKEFQSKGAFYYHCMNCIAIPDTDVRSQMLAAMS